MNISKLIKGERGTHKEKVPVKRKTGTHYEYRRVGKKSGRTGTGKLDKFPESLKKEILEQRGFGESGAKIKIIVENLIDTMNEKDQKKLKDSQLINDNNKLTVTAQALTDWAKKQGIDSKKKRSGKFDEEKEKHQQTQKYLDEANNKIARISIDNDDLEAKMTIIKRNQIKSDEIRNDQRKDIRDLSKKLKTCLSNK